MLFNSYIFIFLFLPLALAGYYGLNQLKKESIKSLITGIEKYGLLWKDKTYYSDLLNEIKLYLLSSKISFALYCN